MILKACSFIDLQHEIWRHLLDGELALAPLKEPKYALDIATGTGLWAYEFARLHPDCQVTGTDLSLIQSDERRAPGNIRFVRADAEDPWDTDQLLPTGQLFDYVHMRATVTCFEDTRTVLRYAFEHMSEGGWIELQDVIFNFYGIDDSFRGTGLQKWVQRVRRGFQASGRDMDKTMYYVSWLLEAGFTDVLEKRLLAPSMLPFSRRTDTWANQRMSGSSAHAWSTDPKYNLIGRLNHVNMREAISSFSGRTMPAAGVGEQESRDLVKRALVDIDDMDIHAYTPM